MSILPSDEPALRTLTAMPFLDRLEMAAISGLSEGTAHNALERLRGEGLADCVRHASPLNASTRRWCITAGGLALLARLDEAPADRLLCVRPVSAHWQRLLLQRMDAVAVIYRLASAVATAEEKGFRFRWFRGAALDATLSLPGGRTLGVIRQGSTAERTAFADRFRRLLDPREAVPHALLALMPDEARLRQDRRLLSRYPGPVFLARERDVAGAVSADRVWHLTASPAVLSLEEVLQRLRSGGSLPVETQLARRSPPRDLSVPGKPEKVPDHLLPVVLKASHKKVLDRLADWPWITASDLRELTCLSPSSLSQVITFVERLGLTAKFRLADRTRLALSRRGLAYLARRDRTSVAEAVQRWGVESSDGGAPATWRDVPGTRSRSLARTIEHTDAVHRFLGQISLQAGERGYRVVQLDPPHRAIRRFRHRGRLRSIQPDAFGVLRRGSETFPFFLEWERRAVRPSTMVARLAPYLRYYSSKQPLDDHGEWPLVLVVFDDYLAEGNFHGVARGEMDLAGVDVPLWVSYRKLVEKVGPLGQAWRSPEVLEAVCPFGVR